MDKLTNDWKFLIVAFLLLGLAPFFPEPHLFGKIRWVAGGAVGMKPMDWFDLFLHGLPMLFVIVFGVKKILEAIKGEKKNITQ